MELVANAGAKIVVVGEGMLELSRHDGQWRLRYGGDTLNTAIHLARAGCDVAFLTALGSDPLSNGLRDEDWPGEGIDASLVLTDPAHGPGLYAIATDDAGERSFTYWRSDSAARRMFDLPGSDDALARAANAELLVYSLITLAILSPGARARLFELCAAVRGRGGKVAFDSNYRPHLWKNPAEARAARDAAIALADIGLPTLEDERALSGEDDAAAVARHWRSRGCGEVIVKLGADGCLLADGSVLPANAILAPTDTSGAGDAFNGGYLAARMKGMDIAEAAAAGHRVAAWVVMQPGAIPPRSPQFTYF